jgi:hypothetical protein
MQKIELKRAPFRADELLRPLVQGVGHPSIERSIDYLFNDPRSPWSSVLADGNGLLPLSIWRTPLALSPGFRKQALRALLDETSVGTITFHPPEEWDRRGQAQFKLKGIQMDFRGSDGDPDTPPVGQECAFRVCDAYAHFYAQYHKGPTFQIFWPEAKRDAGVAACREWLEGIGQKEAKAAGIK